MKLSPFKLERYFAKYEFSAPYLLCSSDCESMRLQDLLALEPAATERFESLWLGYTESLGNPELRRTIAALYETVSPDQVLVHAGAEEAIFNFMNVTLNPGDHVIVHAPYYQSLGEVARNIGAEITEWQGDPKRAWELDLEVLKSVLTPKTKWVVVNVPHNPTGFLPTLEFVRDLSALSEQYGFTIFSDEVYRGLELDPSDRLPGLADLNERAVSLGVMSKTYGLAGLRIGWLATRNSQLLRELATFKDYTTICKDRGIPDWATVHQELRRPGVTLWLLWEEYKATHRQGYQYTWFCQQYRAWVAHTDVVMRQTHRAGEKVFVDYAVPAVPIVDRTTGELRQAQVFVAVLGASNYTYVEATWTEGLDDWLMAHVRAFAFFGGVPDIVVPDNLKTGVQTPHRYEPDINPSYLELAAHYGVAVIPARVRKPRDKAKAESGVLVVERWILARLRHRNLFSLDELNALIRELRDALNQRAFKKLPGSRHHWFTTLEQPALRPLPTEPYVFAQWKKARVNIDYHIDIDRHYYSVPYTLVRQEVEVRLTATTVEVFHQRQRVACHRRHPQPGRHTTVTAHMPKAHREYANGRPNG